MELGPTTALAGALEGLLVADRTGVFTYANPAAEKILGLPATKIVHSTAQAWKTAAVDGKPFPVDELPVVRLLRTGEPTSRAEHALQRADGTQAILSHTATLIRGEAGDVEGAVVSLVDVTDAKHSVERSRTADWGGRAFMDSSPNGIAMHRDGRILHANPALACMLGYSRPDELVGTPVLDIVHPDDRAAARERIRAIVEEGRDVPVIQQRMLHRAGCVVHAEVSALPIVFEGEPTVLAIVVDVSEHKRVQLALDRSLSLLRATLESTADGILVVDGEGKVSAWNEKFLEMWRIPRAVIDRRDDDLAITYVLGQLKDPSSFVAKMRELYASPTLESRDVLELADGRFFERYSKAQRIDGHSVGRVWSFADVTARKHAEADRERLLGEVDLKRQLLQTVIDHAPVGIALSRGEDQVYELVNEGFAVIFGKQARLGRPLADVSPSASSELKPILAKVLETGEPYRAVDVRHLVQRTPGGTAEEAWFWMHFIRVPSPKGNAVLALVVETTEQVIARRRIEDLARVAQRQAAELESIHASMADGVVVCDAAGRITLLNDAATALTGVSRADALNRTLDTYASLVELTHLDGSPVVAGDLPIARALSGETVTSEPLCSVHTGKKAYLKTNATPLRNDAGAIVGAVAVDRDVSEMVEFDLEKDQFVRVAAHELKTPVAIMKGYAQMLLRSADGLPAALAGSLAAIDRGASRIDGLVSDLLDLSQLQLGRLELRSEKIDLPELVDVTTRRVGMSARNHPIRVTQADPVVIRGDRVRLEQVLSALLDNAIRYSPRGGDIDVAVTVEDGTAQVSVRDHGVGIPAGKQGRVFQCFYRAHTDTPYDYGGMGVGLYISRQIVQRLGGTMRFESTEGSGSVFSFRLPV